MLIKQVVLTYEEAFWDTEADLIGCLQSPDDNDAKVALDLDLHLDLDLPGIDLDQDNKVDLPGTTHLGLDQDNKVDLPGTHLGLDQDNKDNNKNNKNNNNKHNIVQKFSNRGRFYMFWNCTATAGQPTLVALMAGDAAHAAETTGDEALVAEATALLRRLHPGVQKEGQQHHVVPDAPRESIVTRWGRDPFCLGSYSYVGVDATGDDYDALARPVGEHLFFAGEATCRTHPATVHGAYLSGLDAARHVLASIVGDMHVPTDRPLIPAKPKVVLAPAADQIAGQKRKLDAGSGSSGGGGDVVGGGGERFRNHRAKFRALKQSRVERQNADLDNMISDRLGPKPAPPKKTNANPFLIYQKDQWNVCKAIADEQKARQTGQAGAKATKNEIRACLGKTWRELPEERKKPWLDKVNNNRQTFAALKTEFEQQAAIYDNQVAEIRQEWEAGIAAGITDEEREAEMLARIEEEEEARQREERKRQALSMSSQPGGNNQTGEEEENEDDEEWASDGDEDYRGDEDYHS